MEKGPDVALLDARNALYFDLGDVSIWRKIIKVYPKDLGKYIFMQFIIYRITRIFKKLKGGKSPAVY